jgi:hypothetical protein
MGYSGFHVRTESDTHFVTVWATPTGASQSVVIAEFRNEGAPTEVEERAEVMARALEYFYAEKQKNG